MSENKDKVIITISIEREINGTVSRSCKMEGEGFHYFELVGLLQMTSYEFAQQSIETAKEIPKDVPTKIKFE